MIRRTWLILFSACCLACFSSTEASAAEVVGFDFHDMPALDLVADEQPVGDSNSMFLERLVVAASADIPLELALPRGIALNDLFPLSKEQSESALLRANSPAAVSTSDAGAERHFFSAGHYVNSLISYCCPADVNTIGLPCERDVYVEFSRPAYELSFTTMSDDDSGLVARVIVHHLENQRSRIRVSGNAVTLNTSVVDRSPSRELSRIEVMRLTGYSSRFNDDFVSTSVEVPTPLSAGFLLLAFILHAPRESSERPS